MKIVRTQDTIILPADHPREVLWTQDPAEINLLVALLREQEPRLEERERHLRDYDGRDPHLRAAELARARDQLRRVRAMLKEADSEPEEEGNETDER